MRLHGFDGGLRLEPHARSASPDPIRPCVLPPELVLPLRPMRGSAALAQVDAGQRVRRGERIAAAAGPEGVPLHAPAGGVVRTIETRASAHAPQQQDRCIVLAVDAEQPPPEASPEPSWHDASPGKLRERIHGAGIVGLGGAAFPTAAKLAGGCDLLIVNGAECEPQIACDDALLRERAMDVVQGARILARALGAHRTVLAIEADMRDAIAATRAAIEAAGAGAIELAVLPMRYPQGGERQLIQALTGREVPFEGLPQDLDVRVQNVATAAACWRAVQHGEPLLSRVVTVAGPGVARPGNFEVAFGTPIAHLVAQAGGYTAHAARLLIGGPLMGLALPHDEFPITATVNCVLVLDDAALRDPAAELPCIRCGECARVCPARLLPQQLHWHLARSDDAQARAHGLFACIECGCCDLVCPSAIPLAQRFRERKAELRRRDALLLDSEPARSRYLARNARLERDAQQRAAEQAGRREQASSADAVQAALERARARKRGGGGPET
jgi:electron transport complex protein RnfC